MKNKSNITALTPCLTDRQASPSYEALFPSLRVEWGDVRWRTWSESTYTSMSQTKTTQILTEKLMTYETQNTEHSA